MYGCGDAKLAETLGKPLNQGKKLKKLFWDANPAIKLLIKDLETALNRNGGWIRGLDGRKVFIREKRKLLNSLLQNGATMVFKKWMCLVDTEVVAPALHTKTPIHQIIAYHDELQLEVYGNKGLAEVYGGQVNLMAEKAGKILNVNVPTQADYKIGNHWADCH